MTNTLTAVPGGWELVLIVLVILLLFGAKKLPELARGSGRAVRTFKAETKGPVDEDDVADCSTTPEQKEVGVGRESSEPIVREQRDRTTI
jgi:sec-independent protein translocase protein TatA